MNYNAGAILHFSFYLFSAIQVFYYLFFFRRLAYFKPKERENFLTHPVSIIICARDEASNLLKNLPHILIQKYDTIHEIIIVNDNSLDESKIVLESFYKKFKKLKIVELRQEAKHIPGKKFPLSVGIKTAKHEIVLLTDADCVPASELWLDKMQQGYGENTEIVLGYAPLNKKKGLLNKLIRWETFHTALQYLSYACAGFAYMGVGRNLSYKKTVFFRLNGFSSHSNISSGDDDLFINSAANKFNTEIVIDKQTFTYSDPPITWKQWKKQKQRHYSTSKLYKPIFKFLLGIYAFSQFMVYPIFITSLLFGNREIIILIFGIRLVAQAYIIYKVMDKLDEKDLFPYFILFDIWMFFYYLIFSFSIFKKPSETWK